LRKLALNIPVEKEKCDTFQRQQCVQQPSDTARYIDTPVDGEKLQCIAIKIFDYDKNREQKSALYKRFCEEVKKLNISKEFELCDPFRS
jgi:hypothetical protein